MRSYKKWSLIEDKRLIRFYTMNSPKFLSKKFPKRSFFAIANRAKKLGLHKEPNYSRRFVPELYLSETEKAYFAGLFDGEGSISTRKHIKNKRSYYYVFIHLGNTHYPTMEFIYKKFGGTMYMAKKRNAQHKNFWRWATYTKGAKYFLEAVMPFLRIKKEQARLAVILQNHLTFQKKGRGLIYLLSKKELKLRESIRNKIHRFNKRIYGSH